MDKILIEISRLLVALKEEQENYKKLVHKLRKQQINNPLDQELSEQLSFYVQQKEELTTFISTTTKAKHILEKLDLNEITDLSLTQLLINVQNQVTSYTNRLNIILINIFQISQASLEYAKVIVESLDLSKKVSSYDEGIKGYICEKITTKVIELTQTHLPFLDDFIDILKLLSPTQPIINKAKLSAALELDIRKKIMVGVITQCESVAILAEKLDLWAEYINDNNNLSLEKKYIQLFTFSRLLRSASNEANKSNIDLSKNVDRLMKASLQELFEKSNTSVTQICEYTAFPLDGNMVDPSKVIKTIFTNDEDINKEIFRIAFPGKTTQVASLLELKKVFPNTIIYYQGQGAASTGMDQYDVSKNYESLITKPKEESRGKDKKANFNQTEDGCPSTASQYANSLAKRRRQEAQDREEQKERIALQAKARTFGIDPTTVKYGSLKELKEIIAEHELLDKIKGFANHARGYGVDEEIVLRLIAARADASKFHEEIAKTDKYKKEIQTKKELSDKNVAFGQDLQLNKTYLLSNTFGIYSKEESRYEKEFGGIFLDNFQAKIKEMARRIATTKATQLIFRATFRHSYNEGTVKEVCQKLTARLNKHIKEIKGKDFHPLRYKLNEVKRTESKDMAGYFVLLKE